MKSFIALAALAVAVLVVAPLAAPACDFANLAVSSHVQQVIVQQQVVQPVVQKVHVQPIVAQVAAVHVAPVVQVAAVRQVKVCGVNACGVQAFVGGRALRRFPIFSNFLEGVAARRAIRANRANVASLLVR